MDPDLDLDLDQLAPVICGSIAYCSQVGLPLQIPPRPSWGDVAECEPGSVNISHVPLRIIIAGALDHGRQCEPGSVDVSHVPS